MAHPFWIINSLLALLLTTSSFFVYFSRVTIAPREDIEPLWYSKPQRQQHIAINLKHIYENDLFGTYKKEPPYSEQVAQVRPLPQPPRPQPVAVPVLPQPAFLDPLNVSLRGIIVISSDEAKNSAIIADNKNDQEAIYKVGDKIQDAQLIRIFNNKIVLLRSNGQQEVIYMRDQDAQTDPRFAQIENWHSSIEMVNATTYRIHPGAFLKRVENIAHFIELLNLTTAYQKGDAVGTRVGQVDPQTLGSYLGLRTGDMILSIQNIPATTTDDRFEIYNRIVKSKLPSEITATILRAEKPLQMKYIIEPFKIETVKATPVVAEKKAAAPTDVQNQVDTREPSELDDYVEPPFENNPSEEDFAFEEVAMLQMLRQKEAFLMVENGALDAGDQNEEHNKRDTI
jgi:type II secretory pathway component PulC